jgi:LuxR family quorum-sensing system transcriptional regulator CciR
VSNALHAVQNFAEAAQAVQSLADLDRLMKDASRSFGADYYLMIHHTNYFQGIAGLVNLGDYPQEFRKISQQDGRPLADPVMEACEKSLTGFFWNEVGQVIRLTDRHLERVRVVQETGLGDGFVVPAHVPGEHLGSCHFATGPGRLLPRENSAALQTIATFGFEAARRLSRARDGAAAANIALTERQRQCVLLCARGKSDAVIGQLLDLSPKTVNAYIEAAKKRYGVATRTQLIANALYASEITFRDIVDRMPGAGAHAALH